jgi:hypothetical protein
MPAADAVTSVTVSPTHLTLAPGATGWGYGPGREAQRNAQ